MFGDCHPVILLARVAISSAKTPVMSEARPSRFSFAAAENEA